MRRKCRLSTAFACLALVTTGGALPANATKLHHPRHDPTLARRQLAYRPVVVSGPPVYGAWHDRLLFPACDRSYPMTENAGCSATGGPSGGIN